ncbi:MAG: FAD:protein FMN transferase, partial [Albidovulum sp.]
DGGDWRASIASPEGAALGEARLANRALATSSPMGTLIGQGNPHILGPSGQLPRWSTVSVSAPDAALADALSTAFCLMDRPAIDRALAVFPGARIELLA